MGPFMPPKTLSMTFFTDNFAQNFSLSEGLCVFTPVHFVKIKNFKMKYRTYRRIFPVPKGEKKGHSRVDLVKTPARQTWWLKH